MPLDGHRYLSSYGWSGKGTGLRRGAIDKPLAIPQKRNLSGLGKDRDDAYPFWDHLYSAATNAITIKIADDSDDDVEAINEDTSPSTTLQLKRTATGIISSRRPTLGTPASGTSTDAYQCKSIIAIVKRDAARKSLYSRFFRGSTLTPHDASNLTTPASEGHLISAETRAETSSDLFASRERKASKKKDKKTPKAEKHHAVERRTRKKTKRDVKASESKSPHNAQSQAPLGW